MTRKEWNKKEIEYLYSNIDKKEIKEIAFYLDRSCSSVQCKLIKLKLKRPTDNWSNEELQFAIDNRFDMSYKKIGECLGRTKNAVQIKLNKAGYKLPQKYYFNNIFFKNIDSEEKAYWLGFIYADGYVGGKYETSIQLARVDKNHLKKFNQSIEGNIKVKDFEKKNSFNKGKTYNMSSIRIYSKIFTSNLKKYFGDNAKTYSIKIPKIDKSLIRHFIRGYFDGDGSLYINKSKNQLRAKITTGSKDFVNDFVSILKEFEINFYVVDGNEKNKSINVGISGKKSTKIFLEWIYNDCSIYLDRKYNFYCNNKHLLEYKYGAWNRK